jgi:hypothetical protein
LVPPLAAVFQAHMAAWRLDGQPRTARRDTTEKHGPLPTPEDRLLCVLVDLKTLSAIMENSPVAMTETSPPLLNQKEGKHMEDL